MTALLILFCHWNDRVTDYSPSIVQSCMLSIEKEIDFLMRSNDSKRFLGTFCFNFWRKVQNFRSKKFAITFCNWFHAWQIFLIGFVNLLASWITFQVPIWNMKIDQYGLLVNTLREIRGKCRNKTEIQN